MNLFLINGTEIKLEIKIKRLSIAIYLKNVSINFCINLQQCTDNNNGIYYNILLH